jgi:4,5-dihydroxyphthalate decarboxylase
MDIQLSIGMASNPRTWPIFEGKVKPDGIDFVASPVRAPELFWRQLSFADFDISEMSMSSLMMTVAAGDDRWVALPIFTTRRMFHTGVMVNKDSGIRRPEDLKGKKLGVPDYQQTAALWTRGILFHEYGITDKDIEFWMERTPDHSHAGAVGFKAPAGVTIKQIPKEKNIGEMVVSGELDGALYYIKSRPNDMTDRSTLDLVNHPAVKPLFPDPIAEGVRYFKKTGIYPINHGMVIKRSIHEKHPWAALNVFKAFEQAHALAEAQRMEHVEYHLESGLLNPDARKALASPILRHGIHANRKTLEMAAQMSSEQALTPRRMTLEELFAPSVMEQ